MDTRLVTFVFLFLNLLVILPMPFIFILGYEPPQFLIDPDDKGSVGIRNEYSWNEFIKPTLGYLVTTLSVSWFGLSCIPRIWRLPSVLIGAVSVLYVNNIIEDKFLRQVVGEGLPQSAAIAHIIQAIAFLSVLIPSSQYSITQQSERTKLSKFLWWCLVLTNTALFLRNCYIFIYSETIVDLEIRWTIDLQHHELASLTYLWCSSCLLLATPGLSWYSSLKYKLFPFTFLPVLIIAINSFRVNRLVLEATGGVGPTLLYQCTIWFVALIYASQLLIPSPKQKEKQK